MQKRVAVAEATFQAIYDCADPDNTSGIDDNVLSLRSLSDEQVNAIHNVSDLLQRFRNFEYLEPDYKEPTSAKDINYRMPDFEEPTNPDINYHALHQEEPTIPDINNRAPHYEEPTIPEINYHVPDYEECTIAKDINYREPGYEDFTLPRNIDNIMERTLGTLNNVYIEKPALSSSFKDQSEGAMQYTAMSNLLLKRDLLLNSVVNFNDAPENYLSWKFSFKNVMTELGVAAADELDLLIKYLGKDSTKSALSMKVSNPHDPARGLSLLWSRLDERFGSPELVESALKNKVNKFSKIPQGQPKGLYDLSDILAEIESVMNYPGYEPAFFILQYLSWY